MELNCIEPNPLSLGDGGRGLYLLIYISFFWGGGVRLIEMGVYLNGDAYSKKYGICILNSVEKIVN